MRIPAKTRKQMRNLEKRGPSGKNKQKKTLTKRKCNSAKRGMPKRKHSQAQVGFTTSEATI